MATRRKRDYYLVLGITKDASESDVKRAFRELARKHHPDVSPDDGGEAFREINEAYAVLSDRESRARGGRGGGGGGGAGAGRGAGGGAARGGGGESRRRRRGERKGADARGT